MPRIQHDLNFAQEVSATVKRLDDRLVEELRKNNEVGQPVILENTYATGRTRVIVIWDEWQNLTQEERSTVIYSAYRKLGAQEPQLQIALSNGLTFPEASAAGMLPYRILPALRKSDQGKVSAERCKEEMIKQGASLLFDPEMPELRFTDELQADLCYARLVQAYPESEQVWMILKDAGRLDIAS